MCSINTGFVFSKHSCVYINTSPCVQINTSSAMYFYDVVIVGRFAPQYKYMVKYIALLVFI